MDCETCRLWTFSACNVQVFFSLAIIPAYLCIFLNSRASTALIWERSSEGSCWKVTHFNNFRLAWHHSCVSIHSIVQSLNNRNKKLVLERSIFWKDILSNIPKSLWCSIEVFFSDATILSVILNFFFPHWHVAEPDALDHETSSFKDKRF